MATSGDSNGQSQLATLVNCEAHQVAQQDQSIVMQNQWPQSQSTMAASGDIDAHSQAYLMTISYGNSDHGNCITR